MAKIEFEDFLAWAYSRPKQEGKPGSLDFDEYLKERGLVFNPGTRKFESIATKPEYYKCIKEYRGFTVGKVYKTNEYGDLPSDPENPFVIWIENPCFKENFRPVTPEEIESIEPEPFKIEKGKWYMCTKSLFSAPKSPMFTKGCLYMSPKDEYLVREDNNSPEIIGAFFIRHFRPATPEEIPHEDYHWNGEIRVRKVTGVPKKMLDNIDEESLQKTREEMLKESSDGELTEFDKEVRGIMASWSLGELKLKDALKEILSVTRKQLQPEIDAEIETAYKNQDEVVYKCGYRKGREETVGNIEQYIKEVPDKLVSEDYMTALRELLQHIKGE